MSGQILMPKLGLTMTEGLVTEWHVAIGDQVGAGDLLFSVETDKIVTDIEARAPGEIIDICVEVGESVPVGSVVATWTGPTASLDFESEEDEADSLPELMEQASPATKPGDSTTRAVGRVPASPVARRLAEQLNIELESVTGTGAGGEIKLADVERVAEGIKEKTFIPEPKDDDVAGTTRPATRIEKIVAQRLVQSKQTIPHFYVQAYADVTELIEARKTINSNAASGGRVSFNDCIILGMARAMAEMPDLNSIWQDEIILSLPSVDIGMAIDTDRGLMAPVLRDVASLDIHALTEQTGYLIARTKSGSLGAEDLEGGAITVSNVGMFGAVTLLPIINPGQSAILGVGSPQPIFRPDSQGAPELRQEMSLAMACDHRIYDGVAATKFIRRLCEILASPTNLLSN